MDSTAVRRVQEAFPVGEEVDFGDGDPTEEGFDPDSWGPERTIPAEVLARLMLGAAEHRPGHRKRLSIAGARVTGKLDLNGTELDCEFSAVRCYFDDTVDLGDARTRAIVMTQCRVSKLDMWGMVIDGPLRLAGTVSGPITLKDSRIGGELEMGNATIRDSATAHAFDATRLEVAGRAALNGLRVHGSVILFEARIHGPLVVDKLRTFAGESKDDPHLEEDDVALDLELAVVSGHLMGDSLELDSWVNLLGCSVGGTVALTHVVVRYPQGPALTGYQMRVGLSLDLSALNAEGNVDLSGAEIGKDAFFTDLALSPGMLVANDIRVGGVLEIQNARLGGLRLAGARVTGPVLLDRATIAAPEQEQEEPTPVDNLGALFMPRAALSDDLHAPGLTVRGGMNLYGASVGGQIVLSDANLIRPGDWAFNAQLLTVNDAFIAERLLVVGGCLISWAKIDNTAYLNDAVFATRITAEVHESLGERATSLGLAIDETAPAQEDDADETAQVAPDQPDQVALDAWSLTVGDDLLLDRVITVGSVVLAGAKIGGLSLNGARLTAKRALDATALIAQRGVGAQGLDVHGLVDFFRADLAWLALEGTLDLDHYDANQTVLLGEDLTVRAFMSLNLITYHTVDLSGSKIAGDLTLMGTIARLMLINAEVAGDARVSTSYLPWFEAFGARFAKNLDFGSPDNMPTPIAGSVGLAQATVQRTLSFAGVEISEVLSCFSLTARRFVSPVPTRDLKVTLEEASIDTLVWSLEQWPDATDLDGLMYKEIEPPPTDRKHVRRWLRNSARRNRYAAQPFQQLAAHLRGLGEDSQARRVLLGQLRAQRNQHRWWRRSFGLMMDGLAGYGYVPSRALLILLASWAAGWAWFARHGWNWRDGLLVLDMIIPTAPFGLEDLGQFTRGDLVVGSGLVAIGWLLSLSLLPAITRALGRN